MKILTLLALMVGMPLMFSSFTFTVTPPVEAGEQLTFTTEAAGTDVYVTASYCGDAGISLSAHLQSKGESIDASNLPPDMDPGQYITMRWYINGVKPVDGPVTPCVCGKYAILAVKNGLTNSVDYFFLFLPPC